MKTGSHERIVLGLGIPRLPGAGCGCGVGVGCGAGVGLGVVGFGVVGVGAVPVGFGGGPGVGFGVGTAPDPMYLLLLLIGLRACVPPVLGEEGMYTPVGASRVCLCSYSVELLTPLETLSPMVTSVSNGSDRPG